MTRGLASGAGTTAVVLALVACTARPAAPAKKPELPFESALADARPSDRLGVGVNGTPPPGMGTGSGSGPFDSALADASASLRANGTPGPSTAAGSETEAIAPLVLTDDGLGNVGPVHGNGTPDPSTAAGSESEAIAPLALTDDGLGNAGPVHGDDAPGYVAFTFDDGPHPAWTPRVLAALAAHDVHATFFIVARQVWGLDHPRRREELAAIAAAGHDIGNHTWSHARLTTIGAAERVRQIDLSGAVIRWIIGRPVTMLRPPYGASGWDVRRLLRARGLTEIGWTIDPKDWAAKTPQALRHIVIDSIERAGGGVLVLHDDKWITATALPGILEDLEQHNCARMAAGRAPILPVSLHYFLHRPIPAAILARTRDYLDGLTARCAARTGEPGGRGAVARGGREGGVDNHTAAH